MATEKRVCGTCTACCSSLEIRDNDGVVLSPARFMCKNCTGTSCAIYDDRPNVCKSWCCDWLEGWGDDNFRPDKIGVIFTSTYTWFKETPTLVEYLPESLAHPRVKEVVAEWIRSRCVVLQYDVSGKKTYVVGKDWVFAKNPREPDVSFALF